MTQTPDLTIALEMLGFTCLKIAHCAPPWEKLIKEMVTPMKLFFEIEYVH
jgi:hypothetical protein